MNKGRRPIIYKKCFVKISKTPDIRKTGKGMRGSCGRQKKRHLAVRLREQGKFLLDTMQEHQKKPEYLGHLAFLLENKSWMIGGTIK